MWITFLLLPTGMADPRKWTHPFPDRARGHLRRPLKESWHRSLAPDGPQRASQRREELSGLCFPPPPSLPTAPCGGNNRYVPTVLAAVKSEEPRVGCRCPPARVCTRTPVCVCLCVPRPVCAHARPCVSVKATWADPVEAVDFLSRSRNGHVLT